MRRAWCLEAQVWLNAPRQSGNAGGSGLLECTVPATTFVDAVGLFRGFLRTRDIELADVLSCESFDLDDWDYKKYPQDSPMRRHILHVVENNCIWCSDLSPLPPPLAGMPSQRARFFLIKASILEEIVPGAKGKTAYAMYAMPPRTLDEALAELPGLVAERQMRMVDVVRMSLLEDWDERRGPEERDSCKALVKAVARGRVWHGPVIFGPA
ncbi:hypothetical protein [Thermogutta sp.]|uniref:hypothetical protein n=1 Tax=Thermogutta sp. TaxID=1962930 RepID=UPI00321F8AF4